MQNRRENGAADQGVDHVIGIRSGKTLGIALAPCPYPLKEFCDCSIPAVAAAMPNVTGSIDVRRASRNFCPGVMRSRMPDIAGVKVGNDAENPLLFLVLDLLFGLIIVSEDDLDIRVRRRNLQHNLRQSIVLPRGQGNLRGLPVRRSPSH